MAQDVGSAGQHTHPPSYAVTKACHAVSPGKIMPIWFRVIELYYIRLLRKTIGDWWVYRN